MQSGKQERLLDKLKVEARNRVLASVPPRLTSSSRVQGEGLRRCSGDVMGAIVERRDYLRPTYVEASDVEVRERLINA